GETLDMLLAPDGSLTKATGRENVRLDLLTSADAPARSIKARTLDADGAPGKGLTAARFAENVEYRQESGKSSSARTAHARTLTATLDHDAIESTVLHCAVKFDAP